MPHEPGKNNTLQIVSVIASFAFWYALLTGVRKVLPLKAWVGGSLEPLKSIPIVGDYLYVILALPIVIVCLICVGLISQLIYFVISKIFRIKSI